MPLICKDFSTLDGKQKHVYMKIVLFNLRSDALNEVNVRSWHKADMRPVTAAMSEMRTFNGFTLR